MKESKASILFRHWVMANAKSLFSCTFEMKQTATDSWPFSGLEAHQEDFSMAIKYGEKGVLIRNESGTIGAPDYSYYHFAPAFIVIYYAVSHMFAIIDIETLLLEKKRSKRKSLTSLRAKEIAWKVINLSKKDQ